MIRKILICLMALAALTTSISACNKLPAYDYNVDMKDYESAITVTDKAYLILANKETKLGNDYVPASLSTLPSSLTLYGKEIRVTFYEFLRPEYKFPDLSCLQKQVEKDKFIVEKVMQNHQLHP